MWPTDRDGIPVNPLSYSGYMTVEAANPFSRKRPDPQRLMWRKPLNGRGVQLWFVASAEGVDALHAAGLVHRDLKPDNQIVGEASFVRAVVTGEVEVTEENYLEILALLKVRAADLLVIVAENAAFTQVACGTMRAYQFLNSMQWLPLLVPPGVTAGDTPPGDCW
jgi:hypothetical protein